MYSCSQSPLPAPEATRSKQSSRETGPSPKWRREVGLSPLLGFSWLPAHSSHLCIKWAFVLSLCFFLKCQ